MSPAMPAGGGLWGIWGASVVWSSSIDGPLGESIVAGEQSSIIVESLSSGTHEIIAAATDGDESCEVRVSLSFGLAPQIAFLSPSNGETFGSLESEYDRAGVGPDDRWTP